MKEALNATQGFTFLLGRRQNLAANTASNLASCWIIRPTAWSKAGATGRPNLGWLGGAHCRALPQKKTERPPTYFLLVQFGFDEPSDQEQE